MLKHLHVKSLFFLLFLGLVFTAQPAKAAPAGLAWETPIAPGVTESLYQWPSANGNVRIGVLRCDLNQPDLNLEVVAGAGEYTRRATVSQMANRTGAVALLNGDYFNMALQGSPIGPSIVNGRLQSSPGVIIGLFSLGIDAERTAHIEPIVYTGELTAADGATFPIDGLNKTYYWHDPSGQESHTDTIQLYNDFWGSASRGHATNSELLVDGAGKVERISWGQTLPYEVPDGKSILQVSGAAEAFIKSHVKEGDVVQIRSGISPERNWSFLIGGHALVLKDGVVQPYVKDVNVLGGIRARTAAGISADGKTIWFISAEGRTNRSVGLTLNGIGQFMQELGAATAVNLDGGGSTTMVSTPLGAFERRTLIAPERFGAERGVVNGIGVFNRTPEGPIAGFTVGGPDQMIVGESASFPIEKAWDANYHAKNPAESSYTWSDEPTSGAWGGEWFLAKTPGEVSIKAVSDTGVAAEKKVQVQGGEALKSLQVTADRFQVEAGTEVRVSLTGVTADGRTIGLSPQVAAWGLSGFSGTVDAVNGIITITDLHDAANGWVEATIGPHTVKAALGNPAYRLLDMYPDKPAYWLDGQKYALDQPPVIVEGRTMVPLRLIAEAYGGDVQWDKESRTVTVRYKGHEIKIPVDRSEAEVDGQRLPLDVPATIRKGRTLIPVRFVSEQLGMHVDYDAATRCVSISERK